MIKRIIACGGGLPNVAVAERPGRTRAGDQFEYEIAYLFGLYAHTDNWAQWEALFIKKDSEFVGMRLLQKKKVDLQA